MYSGNLFILHNTITTRAPTTIWTGKSTNGDIGIYDMAYTITAIEIATPKEGSMSAICSLIEYPNAGPE